MTVQPFSGLPLTFKTFQEHLDASPDNHTLPTIVPLQVNNSERIPKYNQMFLPNKKLHVVVVEGEVIFHVWNHSENKFEIFTLISNDTGSLESGEYFSLAGQAKIILFTEECKPFGFSRGGID